MIPALENDQIVVRHPIDQTMLGIDAARPASAEAEFEGLRLPEALKGSPLDIPNQEIDPSQEGPILLLPVQIVFPGGGRELEVHSSINSLDVALLASASEIETARRVAFFGLRKR